MKHDGLGRPDNSSPRYKPVWDAEQRCYVGRKIEDVEHEEQYARFVEAVGSLVRSQAVLERCLPESAYKRMATIQVKNAITSVRRAAALAEREFPTWMLDSVDDV